MKKCFVWVIIVILAFAGYPSHADSVEYDIQGEWFAEAFYTKLCRSASVNEKGVFVIVDGEESVLLHENGLVEYSNGEIQNVSVKRLSDDCILFYDVMEKTLSGMLLVLNGEDWKQYDIYSAELILTLNGNMIKYSENVKTDYLYMGEELYISNGDKYTRGNVQFYGEDAFMYLIDDEPYIVSYGDYKSDWGTPLMFFVRSNIIE